MTYLFSALALLFFILTIVAYRKIKHSNDELGFIYHWGTPLGAFVWEDLFIFALFDTLLSITTLILKDVRVALLGFIVFWIVRSAGETLYFFLQQFTQPTPYPHNLNGHFLTLRKLFGDISDQKGFIIMQVSFQITLVTFLIGLILLLKNWQYITRWS